MSEILTYSQSLNIIGILLEITGFMMIVPQLVKFFIKIDPSLKTKIEKKSFKIFLFAFGIGFFIIGLLMQLLSVLTEVYDLGF